MWKGGSCFCNIALKVTKRRCFHDYGAFHFKVFNFLYIRAGLIYEATKNSSLPVTGLGNKGPLKVLNGTKLILDDHGNNLDSFRISLESFRSFRGPLLLKPVTGQKLFFAVSYSKPALVFSTGAMN